MIKLNNIHKYYATGDQRLHVLEGINLHIREGELVSIMGSSGSGKSTLLNILGILDTHDEGDYFLAGGAVEVAGRLVGENDGRPGCFLAGYGRPLLLAAG